MKNVAIFCVLVFGLASVAGATTVAATVTTSSAADHVVLGISETLTTNVSQVSYPNYTGYVDEIDVRLTSISGTYLSGADTIPSTASIVGLAGGWSFPGGYAFLESEAIAPGGNPAYAVQPLDGANSSGYNQIGGPNNAPGVAYAGYSRIQYDTEEPSPSFAATGKGAGTSSYTSMVSSFVGGWNTTWTNCDITSVDATPGGAWNYNGGQPTGYGFDNTLIAAFYVTPGTTFADFYTTDGNPFGGSGNYGQFQFSYGGGRTSFVEIAGSFPASPEPATLVLLASGLVGLLAYAWKKRK